MTLIIIIGSLVLLSVHAMIVSFRNIEDHEDTKIEEPSGIALDEHEEVFS